MSHSYSIRNLLEIKDKNITFPLDYIHNEIIKGVRSKIISATLTYVPIHCSNCATLFDHQIIKHGFKKSRITLIKISGFNTFLDLKKQRYLCRHCQSTFTCTTNLVETNCYISNPVKTALFLEAGHKKSECDIARELNVSHSTVNRVINDSSEQHSINFNYLPPVLCFDEFKSVKSAEGNMSFLYCDAMNGTIIDILEDRRLSHLKTYFLRFPKTVRASVTHIVIDMYTPYMRLIKEVFPKAKIVLDKFHVVQLLSRALNKTRIRFMNQNKEYYNKFKHYWRLLLKAEANLISTTYHYSHCFKRPMSQRDIVDFLINLDPELKATYDFYQSILYAITIRSVDAFNLALQEATPLISDYMKTSLNSLKSYQHYVHNLLESNYTNGLIEGINNKIKVIKRVAFGYRSFYHFKARIMIIQNYTLTYRKQKNQAS